MEDIDLDLEVEEDIQILDDRQEHWKEVFEENNQDINTVRALSCYVYMK